MNCKAARGIRDEGVRDEGVRDEGVRDEGVRDEGVRDEGELPTHFCIQPILKDINTIGSSK